MTPLEVLLRQHIAADGPMPLQRYMALCLGHPQHGYYMTRDPLGVRGDFTTAPEISQVFGELIGIWVAQVWIDAGSPSPFSLVELGPGRGTLMRDMLRATRKVKGFADAARVHLVETSPTLKAAQELNVPGAHWHDSVATLPTQFSIIVANEFFDALPLQQLEQQDGTVFERCVDVVDGALALVRVATIKANPFGIDGIFEESPARASTALALGHLLHDHGGATLVIDYGHRKSAMGDTVQAMMDHAYCSILTAPGEADLTSHVDFEALGLAFETTHCRVHPVVTQGAFLSAMGVDLRAQVLARDLADDARGTLLSGVKRLVDDAQMGQLFKVMAATSPGLNVPYPFGVA